jgi:hypothetical protein
MSQISKDDWIFLRKLRDHGILMDVNPELISLINGIGIILCADGDQFDDSYLFYRRMMVKAGLPPRIHVLTMHGGSIVLPKNSPLNNNKRGENLLEQIKETKKIKGINTFISNAHAPCGAAGLAQISILDQFRLHKEADLIIQSEIPDVQAVSLFHVYWGDRRRIYFFSGEKWREFLKNDGGE